MNMETGGMPGKITTKTIFAEELLGSGNYSEGSSARKQAMNNNTEWLTNSFRKPGSESDSRVTDVDYSPALEIPAKVILIGDPGVGKTSYVQRYVTRKYRDAYKWTVGVDFALKVIHWSDNVSIKLQLWDIAGQERFTSMTRVYYKDAHACIIMFDLTQRNTFLNALKWKKDLDSKCSLPDGSPIPCILLANKCDLHHREVDQSEIEEFCKDKAFIGWTETSVKEGLMIDDSMKFLLEDMVSRYSDNEKDEAENEMNGRSIHLRSSSSDVNNEENTCACSIL